MPHASGERGAGGIVVHQRHAANIQIACVGADVVNALGAEHTDMAECRESPGVRGICGDQHAVRRYRIREAAVIEFHDARLDTAQAHQVIGELREYSGGVICRLTVLGEGGVRHHLEFERAAEQ